MYLVESGERGDEVRPFRGHLEALKGSIYGSRELSVLGLIPEIAVPRPVALDLRHAAVRLNIIAVAVMGII